MTTFTPEVAALALSLGLVGSLVCYLFTNLSPGGMVSPAWLALLLAESTGRLVLAVGVIALTYGAMVVLQRSVILFGKRLFAAVVLVGIFLQISSLMLFPGAHPLLVSGASLGFIVPGLVAYHLVRQPVVPTVVATAAVTLITYGVMGTGVSLQLIAPA
jgi:gamma-polyglutamate biosynthesis protein CapC